MLDKGSALKVRKSHLSHNSHITEHVMCCTNALRQICDLALQKWSGTGTVGGSYVEAQPISGFSQRSLVSKSIFHFLVLLIPDCMAVLAGTKM